MIYATCLIVVFIMSQTTINFSNFPLDIWVASFMVCAFQDQRFFNQVQMCKQLKQLLHSSVGSGAAPASGRSRVRIAVAALNFFQAKIELLKLFTHCKYHFIHFVKSAVNISLQVWFSHVNLICKQCQQTLNYFGKRQKQSIANWDI